MRELAARKDKDGQPAHPIVVIVAARREKEGFVPHLMTSLSGEGDDAQVTFALRCSTAANFFFRPVVVGQKAAAEPPIEYRDGGLVANNPSMVTLKLLLRRQNGARLQKQLRAGVSANAIDCLLSIGTGTTAQIDDEFVPRDPAAVFDDWCDADDAPPTDAPEATPSSAPAPAPSAPSTAAPSGAAKPTTLVSAKSGRSARVARASVGGARRRSRTRQVL